MSPRLMIAMALALAIPLALAAPRQIPWANAQTTAEVVFSEIEKRLIHDYYRDRGAAKPGKKDKSGLPPGLAKKESLPPGLRMQLERNGHLPPGLEKRALPSEIESKLRHRAGIEHVIVDDDVLLVVAATGLILDIIRDVAND